ncbi:MAG: WD40 repeat domain-containing protein, partial [Planctomycetota bacterium]
MAETPRTWAAKAAADARWAPTLVRVLSAGTITAMAPTPGSDKLLLACDDGKIRVFDIGTGKEEHAIDSGAAKITALLAKPTGDRFFAGGTDGAVRGFLIADGEPAGWLAPDQEEIPPITALAITKDGNFLYAGHEDGTVRAWVPSMGKLVVTEREHEAAIIGFAWAEHEDGLRLYSGSLDGTVKSWLPLPLAVHDTFQGREGEIAAVGVDPHGLRVCAATLGHVVDMWETGTHRESTVLEGAAPRARQALINDAHTRLA